MFVSSTTPHTHYLSDLYQHYEGAPSNFGDVVYDFAFHDQYPVADFESSKHGEQDAANTTVSRIEEINRSIAQRVVDSFRTVFTIPAKQYAMSRKRQLSDCASPQITDKTQLGGERPHEA
ncbi:hypothetical protein HG530_014621 [Fusarium avenaceum]|nr:hypothetical protein HG530_014621 [Fusarium avenaceum]